MQWVQLHLRHPDAALSRPHPHKREHDHDDTETRGSPLRAPVRGRLRPSAPTAANRPRPVWSRAAPGSPPSTSPERGLPRSTISSRGARPSTSATSSSRTPSSPGPTLKPSLSRCLHSRPTAWEDCSRRTDGPAESFRTPSTRSSFPWGARSGKTSRRRSRCGPRRTRRSPSSNVRSPNPGSPTARESPISSSSM